ncbi:MAG TPA: YegS/Rv2252/BmrU family lipid kinase [Verrucomicrobiae bacterium]|nr:YegS/Rv2252/BmrU family lipid kinase [Verrucomicrobiae bacterium]
MRTIVFINSHSRLAAQNIKLVKKFFAKPGSPFDVQDFIVVEDLSRFKDALKKLQAAKDIDCVIVGSGDGTIVAVLNALKKQKNMLYGFIPLGTTNGFVRSLGIPVMIKRSLSVLSKQHERHASLGRINDTLFANFADLGYPVQVVDNVTDKVKRYLGSFAYAVSGVRELARHEPFWCEVEANGKKASFQTHHLLIGNGRHRGLAVVDHGTSAYDDSLTIAYSTSLNRVEYLKDAFGFITRRPEKRAGVHFIYAKKATIRTKPDQPLQADGEIITTTPAHIRVLKDAIRVLAPPSKRPGK